jgi:hypothetical protein
MERPHNRQAFRRTLTLVRVVNGPALRCVVGLAPSATDGSKDVRACDGDVAGESTRDLPHDQTMGVSVKNVVGRKDVGLVGREISDSRRDGP